ncbi:MAG: hypothetical protein FWC64_02710 [Treponema sp.]|nr:hypothetical protein [Treponema sp.]
MSREKDGRPFGLLSKGDAFLVLLLAGCYSRANGDRKALEKIAREVAAIMRKGKRPNIASKLYDYILKELKEAQ